MIKTLQASPSVTKTKQRQAVIMVMFIFVQSLGKWIQRERDRVLFHASEHMQAQH